VHAHYQAISYLLLGMALTPIRHRVSARRFFLAFTCHRTGQFTVLAAGQAMLPAFPPYRMSNAADDDMVCLGLACWTAIFYARSDGLPDDGWAVAAVGRVCQPASNCRDRRSGAGERHRLLVADDAAPSRCRCRCTSFQHRGERPVAYDPPGRSAWG